MPISNNKFSLRSKVNSAVYKRPLFLVLFIDLIAALAFGPGEREKYYHFDDFFGFVFFSAGIYILIVLWMLATRKSLEINDEKIILKHAFTSKLSEYNLSDIVDFKWSNRPERRNTRYGTTDLIKNETIQIILKEDRIIEIDFSAYENFDEIKQFFYNYCVKNKIITVRSLEDRRYGTSGRRKK